MLGSLRVTRMELAYGPHMEINTTAETLATGQAAVAPVAVTPVSPNLKWGSILGGAVASLAIAAMLYALGLALGLSWIDPRNPDSLRPSGIFSGIWLVVVSLIALFVGGFVSARGAGALTRGFGAMHGLVMWGVSVVVGAWLLGNVVSAVLRGGFAVGAAATHAVAGALPSPDQLRGLPAQLGVSSNDMMQPVNQRLRDAGKPEVTAQQLENATRDTLRRSVRDGRLNREMLTQAISTNTSLSRADAEQVATDAEIRFQQARAEMKQELAEARQAALAAAEDSSKAFWVVFGALLLGMLSAMGGAALAAGQSHRPSVRRATPPRPATGGHTTEAYP